MGKMPQPRYSNEEDGNVGFSPPNDAYVMLALLFIRTARGSHEQPAGHKLISRQGGRRWEKEKRELSI